MSGFSKGGRDYLLLGTYNVYCAYCGRKRKANEMTLDDEFARGLLVCKEHRDLRHPQEFARGIKEDMTVPKVQPAIVAFTSLNTVFPISVTPNPLTLPLTQGVITTEGGIGLETESGSLLITETGSIYLKEADILLPGWVSPISDPFGVYVTSVTWSWQSGGAGINILSPNSLQTNFQAVAAGLSGVAKCVVVNSLLETGTVLLPVNT